MLGVWGGVWKWMDSYPPPPVTTFYQRHISPPSPCVTAEIHRSSPCISLPSWRGQGDQKGNGFLWRKRRKACQHSRCFAHTRTLCCSSLSAMQEFFYKRGKSGSKPGFNVCLSVSYSKRMCVCVCGGGGLVPPTRSAACLSSCTLRFFFFFHRFRQKREMRRRGGDGCFLRCGHEYCRPHQKHWEEIIYIDSLETLSVGWGGIRAASFNVLMYSAIVSSTVAAVRCTRLLQSCCCKTLMTMQWAQWPH